VKDEMGKVATQLGTVVSVDGDRAKVRTPSGTIIDAKVV
jgi:hypothetical protein